MNNKTKQRFLIKTRTNMQTGCIEWIGAKKPNGYGNFFMGGKTYIAHRAIWVLRNGAIPNGMNVLHKCDNPSCVNIDHLFIGSPLDNHDDMYKKKRDNKAKKLVLDDIEDITKLRAEGKTLKEIGNKYGVSESNIHYVLSGKTWLWRLGSISRLDARAKRGPNKVEKFAAEHGVYSHD